MPWLLRALYQAKHNGCIPVKAKAEPCRALLSLLLPLLPVHLPSPPAIPSAEPSSQHSLTCTSLASQPRLTTYLSPYLTTHRRDLEHGEHQDDPPPRHDASTIATTWAPYIQMDTPQNIYKALNTMYDHKPVLLRGTPLVERAVHEWSFGGMAAAAPAPTPTAGPRTEDEVQVQCSDRKKHRFYECDDSKNIPAGPYYLREPETQRLMMTVPEFVQCAATWENKRVMLKSTIMTQRMDPNSEVIVHVGNSSDDSNKALTGPAEALHTMVAWEWLHGLRRSQGFGPIIRVDVEAATTGALQPARYDLSDQLIAQLRGRRRVLLFPPTAAFQGLYPFPVAHPYDKYSMVDLENLDHGQWPGCGQLTGVKAVLRPGDCLFVPAYWFVHEQDLEPQSASLRFILHPGTRAPSQEAASLRVSRAVEQRVTAVEGPSGVKRWLSLIASGNELRHLDLGTVMGYKRAVMCQDVRDEVEQGVGPGTWATALPAICANRLMPTPWLNKDYREPLLLSDTPVVYQDTRTEEERKYPQLFRRKLEREGWSVPPNISTVPIPGVNC